MITRKLGWKKQKEDARDLKIQHLAKVRKLTTILPVAANLRKWCSQIEDQGNLGSCTANAWSGILQFDENKYPVVGRKYADLSRLFIYYNERLLDGTVSQDSGAELRDGAKVINQYGVCVETEWPYNVNKFTVKPTSKCYTDALPNAIHSYYLLDGTTPSATLINLKTAIASGQPFVFGFNVYDSFMNDAMAASGVMPMPNTSTEQIQGGHAVCFTQDTKVSLLDGTEKSFAELLSSYSDKSFWVYSCDENGNVVPGLAHSPRKTAENQSIVKVTLDNGEIIRCTKNHPFLMRDGLYKPAEQLQSNDSLMPLYRKKEPMYDKSDYEMFLNPRTQRWCWTHRIAMDYFGHHKGVVHHKDFNRFNNSIDNLEIMSWVEHTKLHQRQTVLLEKYSKSDTGRQKSRELMEKLWANSEWREKTLAKNHANGELLRQRGIVNEIERLREIEVRHNSHEYKEMRANIARENLKKTIGRPLTDRQRSARRSNALRNFSPEIRGNAQIKTTYKRFYANDYPTFDAYLAAKNISFTPINHKVVSVVDDGREDVYDLTVDKYHNFALTSGVFVHNCAVGYDDSVKRFLVRNSWGTSWGLPASLYRGYFTVPYAIFTTYDNNTNSYMACDAWTVIKEI